MVTCVLSCVNVTVCVLIASCGMRIVATGIRGSVKGQTAPLLLAMLIGGT